MLTRPSIFAWIVLLLTITDLLGQSVPSAQDSMAISKRHNLKLSTRLQSLGLFNFSGRIANDDPVLDLTLNYDRKRWGIMTFHAFDLVHPHSDYNFSLSLLYTRIKIGQRITVTPHTGFSIEGRDKFNGDRQILISSLKVTSRFHIDNTMMFANVVTPEEHDWVNRFRLLYSADEHLDLIFSVWHNNRMFDDTQHVSTSLNTSYNRVKVSEHIVLNTGVTVLVMAESSDKEEVPMRNGVVFTVNIVVD